MPLARCHKIAKSKPTLMLSLIRLFLYPFSSASNRLVSILFAASCASSHAWSKAASGSEGAATRRHSTASLYRWVSLPRLASAMADFKASTHKGTELRPMRKRRSKRARPGYGLEGSQPEGISFEDSRAPTFVVLDVKIQVELGGF